MGGYLSDNKEKKEIILPDFFCENEEYLNDNPSLISLGINIGSSKTVYSIFSKQNEKYMINVLLMNNSKRIIPSVICYKKENTLFGDECTNYLQKNLNTSFNNLSRLIGFNKEDNLFKEELNYMFNKEDNLKFQYYNEKNKIEIETLDYEVIIADYLSLINEYYFQTQKIEYDITCISVPDFFTPIQKQKLNLICEGIGMKNINIYNESSAITMYYGYTKYNNLFNNNQKEINVLFIDIGHSKTSFILSNFKYDEFKVVYVLNVPLIGGRNIDLLLYDYCISQLKKNINEEMKFKLIKEINKKKKDFVINNEIQIVIENESIIIKKETFKKIIKNLTDQLEKEFDKIQSYLKQNEITFKSIEIIGEIMRIPIFQEIIQKKNYKISKTILIDECLSAGAALLGSFYNNIFPFDLKHFYHYNNYNIFIEISSQNDKFNSEEIIFPKGTIDKENPNILFNEIIDDNYFNLKIFYECEKKKETFFSFKNLKKNKKNYKIEEIKINYQTLENFLYWKIKEDFKSKFNENQLLEEEKKILNIKKHIKKQKDKNNKYKINKILIFQNIYELKQNIKNKKEEKIKEDVENIDTIFRKNYDFEKLNNMINNVYKYLYDNKYKQLINLKESININVHKANIKRLNNLQIDYIDKYKKIILQEKEINMFIEREKNYEINEQINEDLEKIYEPLKKIINDNDKNMSLKCEENKIKQKYEQFKKEKELKKKKGYLEEIKKALSPKKKKITLIFDS
jgi:molecular chaperone DnaK (HSP70)